MFTQGFTFQFNRVELPALLLRHYKDQLKEVKATFIHEEHKGSTFDKLPALIGDMTFISDSG